MESAVGGETFLDFLLDSGVSVAEGNEFAGDIGDGFVTGFPPYAAFVFFFDDDGAIGRAISAVVLDVGRPDFFAGVFDEAVIYPDAIDFVFFESAITLADEPKCVPRLVFRLNFHIGIGVGVCRLVLRLRARSRIYCKGRHGGIHCIGWIRL